MTVISQSVLLRLTLTALMALLSSSCARPFGSAAHRRLIDNSEPAAQCGVCTRTIRERLFAE